MTKIALNTCNNSYLFCFPRSTEMTFFSSLFTSLNYNDINYMILINNLLFTDTDFCNYAQKDVLRQHSCQESLWLLDLNGVPNGI